MPLSKGPAVVPPLIHPSLTPRTYRKLVEVEARLAVWSNYNFFTRLSKSGSFITFSITDLFASKKRNYKGGHQNVYSEPSVHCESREDLPRIICYVLIPSTALWEPGYLVCPRNKCAQK